MCTGELYKFDNYYCLARCLDFLCWDTVLSIFGNRSKCDTHWFRGLHRGDLHCFSGRTDHWQLNRGHHPKHQHCRNIHRNLDHRCCKRMRHDNGYNIGHHHRYSNSYHQLRGNTLLHLGFLVTVCHPHRIRGLYRGYLHRFTGRSVNQQFNRGHHSQHEYSRNIHGYIHHTFIWRMHCCARNHIDYHYDSAGCHVQLYRFALLLQCG